MKINISSEIVAYPDSHELEFFTDGKSEFVKIEPLAMSLLIYMVNKKCEVCTTEELIENLWDGNKFVGKSALRKLIYKLRLTFSEFDKKDLINTIPKKGYRFNCDKTISQNKTTLKKFRPKKILFIVLILILLIIILKIIFPGLFHFITHRLFH